MALTEQEHLVDKLLYLRYQLEATCIPQYFIDHISVNVCRNCQYNEAARLMPAWYGGSLAPYVNSEGAIFHDLMGFHIRTVPSGACIQCH